MQQVWQNLENEIKGQVRQLADAGENGDQIFTLGKLMNMKDKLMQQILAALLYKKTVVWTDLKINPGASRDTDEIYASQKVVDVRNRIDNYLATQ